MIGDRISSRRKQLKLTQEELAEMVGTSQTQISKYEKNQQEPTAGVISRLADALDTTADWLLGRIEIQSKPLRGSGDLDVYEQLVIKKMREIKPDERKFLVKMLENVG